MLGPTAMSKPPTGTLASASRDHPRRCIRLLRRYEMTFFSRLFSTGQASIVVNKKRRRPNSVQFAPFTDSNTLQGVSFVNLPIDGTVHRDLFSASFIPAASPGPQTAAFGSSYLQTPTFALSPDTPPKSPPDDTSYSAPSGGIVAALQYQVLAGQASPPQDNLILDVDDADPNGPGSGIAFFDGSGSVQLNLSQFALGDGYHAEGAAACAAPTPAPPTPT